ncbi:MAG: hypothetical protein P8Y54_11490 [Xanthomonadales bacterium]
MAVRIDQTGQHGGARQVDLPGVGIGRREFCGVADARDASRRRDDQRALRIAPVLCIEGVDAGIAHQRHAGIRVFRGIAGRRERSETGSQGQRQESA